MSWTVTDPIWIGKAIMCVDRQVRKPASCWYRNIFPNHEELVVPIYSVLSRRSLAQAICDKILFELLYL